MSRIKNIGIIEPITWFALAIIALGRPIYFSSEFGWKSLIVFYHSFAFSLVFFSFPIVFKLIFGEWPIKQILSYININSKQSFNYDSKHILEISLAEAKRTARKMSDRASLYVLVGVIIAFIGIGIFYYQIAISKNYNDGIENKLSLYQFLTRFSTLVLLESIAFFFLRQHRQMMEEYRYYEAIKRQREDQVFIKNTFIEFESKMDKFEKLIMAIELNSNRNSLKQNETTGINELNKYTVNEINSITNLLKQIKLK